MKKTPKIILSIAILAATSGGTLGVKEIIDNNSNVLVTMEDGTKILKSDINEDLFKSYGASQVQSQIQSTLLNKYYEVEESAVNEQFNSIKSSYPSVEEFLSVLNMYGYEDENALKNEIKNSLLNEKATADLITVSKKDVTTYFEDNNDFFLSADYQHVSVPEQNTANEIYKALKNGTDFNSIIEKYGIEDDGYNTLANISKADIDATIAKVVFADMTAKEKLFEPIATEAGYIIAYATNFKTLTLENDYDVIENNFKMSSAASDASQLFLKLVEKGKVEFKESDLEKDIKQLFK